MKKHLVIVESPAKAKPIEKYLGKDYTVSASVGHIKDLPEKSFGVDISKDFKPQYDIIAGKSKIVKELKKQAKKSEEIYLAMDPDREGEAIAFHLAEEIGSGKQVHRVLFNEITKNAIIDAFSNPKDLDESKYNSQKARRILDRLVGYQISPILWDKVRRGLSAGRVQSVAVRIIDEREKEIRAFKSEEYWSLKADFENNEKKFEAKLFKISNKKPALKNEKDTNKILEECKKNSPVISKIEKSSKKRNPSPPFITSTLQQEAARKLKFTAKKTMIVAQQLYEGIDIGHNELTGLITYMRTDSTRVSDSALDLVRDHILKEYGKDFLPKKPKNYLQKKKGQDAHEAIRPTRFDLPPKECKKFLSPDQLKLYTLIWNRFLACQMESAKFDLTTVDINLGKATFRAIGNIMTFPGFTQIYMEGQDKEPNEDDKEGSLPPLKEDDTVKVLNYHPNQHFTQPPPRYTEATLIKELEEKGIGRPSTFATIISTILDKEYVLKDNNQLKPTDLGSIVTELLVESFPKVLNPEFTATMETELDDIEDGKQDWVKTLKNFYKDFEQLLKTAKKEMRNIKREEIATDIDCPTCGSKMNIKWGKNGQFLACSRYPDCTTTQEFTKNDKGEIEIVKEEKADEQCPSCKSDMIIKKGKYGRFLACTRYPECKTTLSFKIGINCPKCNSDIIEKSSKRGKLFFSCIKWPECSFSTWYKPINEPCPVCGATILLKKKTQKDGITIFCHKKECGYSRKES